MITAQQTAELEKKRTEKKEREAQDSPAEKREVVMHGASLKCKYAQALGKLVVTSNELLLQDQKWATEGDGNNMVNLQFAGTCGHPKWPQRKMTPPPCMAVIKLSPWQNVGTNFVQEQKNLVKESYIECEPEFNAAKAKPIPKVTSIEYKTNKILNFERITPYEMELFETAHFKVTKYEIAPKESDKKSVKWLIDYGNNKQDIFNQNEQLKLYVGDKDCYNSEFKVFAYLKSPNPNLFVKVKVKKIIIQPRANWAARNPQTGGDYSYEKITTPLDQYYDTIVIHHSGNAKHFPGIKDIQNEHMDEMDKADIGYHYAVDKNGLIYEGRPIDVKGAHVDKANTGKIGIVLLGDLSTDNAGIDKGWLGGIKLNAEKKDGDDYITDKMEKGLLKLCIHLDMLYKIDIVAGHMEIASSSNTDERYCPGNLTMAKMDDWRKILEKKKP